MRRLGAGLVRRGLRAKSLAIFPVVRDNPRMALWLFAFVFGIYLGRATPSAPWLREVSSVNFLALLAGIFLILSTPRFSKLRRHLPLLAVAWGFSNAAPRYAGESVDARVVKVDSWFGTPRPALVTTEHGVFHANVPFAASEWGRLDARGFRPELTGGADRPVADLLVSPLRALFHERLAQDRPFMRNWLVGLILGERTTLPVKVVDAFKKTGTYHLLAVSGLHVSLIVLALSLALRAPFQIAYAARVLSPGAWRQVAAGLNVAAVVMALVYLALTGVPAAAQRAVLTFGVVQLAAVFSGLPSLKQRILAAAVAQTLFFPIGFVSPGAMMSWAAYLVVIDPSRGALRKQVLLTAMAAAAFGQLPLLGIAANLLLVPVFSLLLVLGVLAVILPQGFLGRGLLLEMHASFIDIVMALARLIDAVPWLSLSGDALPVGARAAFWVLSALGLSITCRNLSIRGRDLEDTGCQRSLG